MAFWRRKEDEYSEMVELIEQQPGISARELAVAGCIAIDNHTAAAQPG